jgi:hypothetical protein
VFLTRHALVGHQSLISKTAVCLDTAASKSIFCNKKLLTNIRDAEPIVFIGIKGSLTASKVGNFQGIIDCYLSEEANANILSYSELVADKETKITSGRTKFKLRHHDSEHLFEHHDGSYIKVFPEIEEPDDSCAVAMLISVVSKFNLAAARPSNPSALACAVTVREMEDQYPVGDVKQAKAAHEFRRKLGVPTNTSIVKMLLHNGNGILGFQSRHLDIADNIYGRRIADLAGKSVEPVNPPPRKARISIIPKVPQIIHADVMFLDSVPFLVSVVKTYRTDYDHQISESASSSTL